MVKELNHPEVTRFFEEATSEEEAHFRYRCFIDWNGLELSEWYKDYLTVSRLLINWCRRNDIKYKYKKETPPKNYMYDGRDLTQEKWVFFYKDLKYFNN